MTYTDIMGFMNRGAKFWIRYYQSILYDDNNKEIEDTD